MLQGIFASHSDPDLPFATRPEQRVNADWKSSWLINSWTADSMALAVVKEVVLAYARIGENSVQISSTVAGGMWYYATIEH